MEKQHHVHAAALDYESKTTLAKLIGLSQRRLAQNTGHPITCQLLFKALLYLPAVDRSRLQCVSMILIWLVLVLTDLWELLVDLLYN